MNKFSRKIRAILINYLLKIAGKKEDLVAQYPDLSNDIEYFTANDPSNNLKYLPWEVKVLRSGQALKEEISDVAKLFHKHINLLKNKDIYSYNFTELRDQLFQIEQGNQKSKRKEKLEIKTQGGQRIWEDDQCIVLLVKDKAASCFYGRETKWCITMSDRSYFEEYAEANVVFFFVLRKDLTQDNPNYKVAIVYQRDENNNTLESQFWDASDTRSDDKILSSLKNKNNIIGLTKEIAKKEPKGLLAKLKNNEIKPEDLTDKDLKSNSTVMWLVKKDEFVNPERLISLYNELNDEEKVSYFTNYKFTPSFILEDLIKRGAALVLIAQHPNASPSILENLSKYENHIIRNSVASNVKTPPHVLEYLSNDVSETVRRSVARHRNTPPLTLSVLSKDPDTGVLQHVAYNRNTPVETLIYLSDSKELPIKKSLLYNINTPEDIRGDIRRRLWGLG